MLGGKAQSGHGLGLPPGERVHFASNVMTAGDDWPQRCNDELVAIAPEEAIFLWPSAKQAGADLRAVVGLLRQELGQLARQRASGERGRVPERPLLALAKLRAGLTLMAQATNTTEGLDDNAVVFAEPAALAEPARLPLYAGSDAALDVWAGQDGLEATAMDRRGISWLRIESGKVERARVKRTSLVRATMRERGKPYIVWAMPPSRCEEDEDRCVRRATGIAELEPNAIALPDPIWLGGHPAGRVDRSLRLQLDGRVDLLARASAEGALELRRYVLERPQQEKAPPLSPEQRWPLPEQVTPADALLLDGSPAALAYATRGPSGAEYWLWRYEGAAAPERIAGAAAAGDGPWLAACRTDATTWLVLGAERGLQVLPITGGGRGEPVEVELALDAPLHADDPARDGLRLLCDDAQLTMIGIARDRALAQVRCDGAACARGPDVAKNVTRFDGVRHGEHTLVAYTTGTAPEIHVAQLGADGAAGDERSPAACWDPMRGMCGQPTLVSDGKRLLLAARDGSDLLALESEDGGASWTTMSGLQVSTAISTDASTPMDQHRIRKGLEHH
jgi:hypothetical protein